jgi:hypothetical protein
MAKRAKAKTHDVSLFPPPDSIIGQRYGYVTQRPWPSLIFVLPMLLIFEIGSYWRQSTGASGSSGLVAPYLIEWLVNSFSKTGTAYPHLLAMAPGLLVIAILLAWHIVARHPWTFDINVLPGMLGESIIWTIPLFMFNRVLQQADLAGGVPNRGEWVDSIIRSFGAGIYEELVFRLICITILVILLIDVMRLPRSAAAVFIMLFSSALFAAQHHPPLGAEPFTMRNFMFRTAAGLYLSGIFAFRGFGIAAGCHSFYNVILNTIQAV